ncbi:hypothetical protein [Flavobacterium sp. WG21]|uniref:hypothetical protein n=1 Tax=Flavobacterium sp. WG21 TaxID=1229487 RepID=UPI0003480D42|nr:hypothetical protein [Flavobacterium sp. WG21]
MSENNTDTLLEVRKAYRLLFEYQTRILDLVDFIGSSYGYSYNGGYSKFSNGSPNNGTGKLTQWAWDWLSMYFYEFNFGRKDEKTFAVFIVNDTGFFQTRKKGNVFKTKVSSFDAVENSKTKLIFVVGKNIWNGWGKDWDDDHFILDKEGHKKTEDKIMLFKSYPLEDFFDEDNAIENLRDFENYCKSLEVDFKYKEKAVS